MSHRPIDKKHQRRVAKALRRQAPPRYFDLVQWLIDHQYAGTRKQARKVILAGRVRANSHKLGIKTLPIIRPDGKMDKENVVAPHVPVEYRDQLMVLEAPDETVA